MDQADCELYTDGGGDRSGVAACASILIDRKVDKQWNTVLFLGGATNNEAEITGALLGISVIHHLRKKSGHELGATPIKSGIDWYADSEYTLKGATEYIHTWQKNGWRTAKKEPVKNQGLWRAWLELSRSLRVRPHHVRGHSGHSHNEACDAACNWAKAEGVEFLDDHGNGAAIEIPGLDVAPKWQVFDGRDYLAALRSETPSFADCVSLIDSLDALSDAPLEAPRPDNSNRVGATLRLVEEVERAMRRLKTRASDDGDLSRFCESGEALLKRWREKNGA